MAAFSVSVNIIFGYAHYEEMFPHCDVFNKNLCGHTSHRHTHPHRTGSGKQPGEEGHAGTMAMATILQNTFTLYEYLNDIPSTGQGSVYFENHGVALAEELFLFQFYIELQENQKAYCIYRSFNIVNIY